VKRHYFDKHTKTLFDEYKDRVRESVEKGRLAPAFPEKLITHRLLNTWHDSAEALVGNWLGLVYQVTHRDRTRQFMNGVDRDDPLGWLAGDVSRLT